nr:integrase, catalytic region, zinc finger, CCHC-type, peptidase aspartic, catalytic [Tanacetum cinerariifolium]
MLVPQSEGSGTPTESHHTPTSKASQSSQHKLPSPSLPPVPPESLPTVIPTDTPPLRQYTRRTRIAQSLVLPPIADKPASSLGDDSQGEACPTDSGFEEDQDRANIAKTSTLPSNSTPMVTSLAADEGSMQHKLDELTALCTSLQRQQLKMVAKFEAQELEINSLKARIKVLEDKERGVTEQSGDDALIKGTRLDEGEEVAERVSDDTEEMATVLTSMDAASILISGGVQMVPTAAEVATATITIPTGSRVVSTASPIIPTAAPIFTIATESTPYTKRKGKEYMVESDTPKKKKLQEQTSKVLEEVKATEEVPKERVKEMLLLVPVEETYAEALQVKHPIIDWKVHTEGQRSYWKITRLGGSSAIKESLSIRPAASDKQMELWVELKRLYEPDGEDQLWIHNQNLMHAPVEWKLYDMCGVHHVTSKDKEIFMLVEKDYPLEKGLAIVMICYKLHGRIVGNKMHKAFPLSVMEFSLPEEVPTASKESSHCQKKRDATEEKIALLLKSSSNCQSKSYDSYAKSCSKEHHMCGDRSRLNNFVKKFIGTVRFGNDHFGAIMGYGDYVFGDSVISRVSYVEGLIHNLFSVGQFCDSDLKVTFKKHSCYVQDTDGVELIKGSRGSNLYTISVEDMLKSSPICLLSKASKNKSWLWHRLLNH